MEFGSDIGHANREAITSFVTSPGCRRVVLGAFLDGRGVRCDELGPELCNRCRAQSGTETSAGEGSGDSMPGRSAGRLTRFAERTREDCAQLRRLHCWLDDMRTVGCSVCDVKWQIHGSKEEKRYRYDHGRTQCRLLRQKEVDRWQAQMQFADYECCWECELPFGWCEKERVEGRCPTRDRVLPVGMMGRVSGTIEALVQERFGDFLARALPIDVCLGRRRVRRARI